MMKTESGPSDVYARQLLAKHYGYPLFVPEPDDSLPPAYRSKGTSIGDVGIITSDGSFDFLFNICASVDDPVNCYGVPDGFERVKVSPGEISLLSNMHPPGSDVSSASVNRENITLECAQKENEFLNIPAGVSAGYSFTSASSEAAILVLPEGGSRQNLRNLALFRRHAIKNALRWYQYVNATLGREAPNGSLYLVTGCDKSTTWGVASLSGASEASSVSLKFTAAQLVQANAKYTYSWETHCPATVRIGPELCGSPDRLQNQCVFLRGFKLAVREGPMAALKGAAKLSSIVNSKPDDILPGSNRSYIPFNNGKWSGSGKSAGNGGSGGGQQLTHSSSKSSDTGAEIEGDVPYAENVILELVPGATEVYHPLNIINKYLLATTPEAQVVVTHESDWWALSENNDVLPTDDVLLARLHNRYQPSTESGGVFLVPRDMKKSDKWDATSMTPRRLANYCTPSNCILFFFAIILLYASRFVGLALVVDFGTSRGQTSNAGVDIRAHGNHVYNMTNAVGITRSPCQDPCGAGMEAFEWSTFSQQFSAWLLPWLALISQMPFGANRKRDDLISVILAVGSPTLAAYSLALTVLNGHWLAQRFSDISYPNVNHAVRILNSLQQAPLRITNKDGLLASLVVLPDNDDWWSELAVLLNYTHTWSISSGVSITWVFMAYMFTLIDAFTSPPPDPDGFSGGQSVGSAWLWLLPVVVGWLQISPQCNIVHLKNAVACANEIAFVATPSGTSKAFYFSDTRAFTLRTKLKEADDATFGDEDCSAPIFNYARILSWTENVEMVVDAFRSASTDIANHQQFDGPHGWHNRIGKLVVHPGNRRGTLGQVPRYCIPTSDHGRRSHWGSTVWSRMFLASLAALSLQWGTAGAASIIVYYTPTIGMDCRSGTFLLYAVVSTVVWMLLLISSILTHQLSSRHALHLSDPDSSPNFHGRSTALRSVIQVLAVVLRRSGRFLATCNTIGIVMACILQFSGFYDPCYCTTVLGLLSNTSNAITTQGSDAVRWAGVTLALASAGLFIGFVNIFINPTL